VANSAREMVDRFYSLRLGISLADLKPGQVAVATCDRRTYAEVGYGFIVLLWVVHLGDRAAVSVHPAALAEVSRLAWGLGPEEVMGDAFRQQAADALQSTLPGAQPQTDVRCVTFFHPGDVAVIPTDGEVGLLGPADAAKWVGERVYLPAAEHPGALRGEAFGLFLDDKLIADAYAHDPSVAEMGHLIAEDAIEVSEAYRRQGYGKALLAFWTREMQARGRVCIHTASPDNPASVALARSAGYVEYAREREIRVPAGAH